MKHSEVIITISTQIKRGAAVCAFYGNPPRVVSHCHVPFALYLSEEMASAVTS